MMNATPERPLPLVNNVENQQFDPDMSTEMDLHDAAIYLAQVALNMKISLTPEETSLFEASERYLGKTDANAIDAMFLKGADHDAYEASLIAKLRTGASMVSDAVWSKADYSVLTAALLDEQDDMRRMQEEQSLQFTKETEVQEPRIISMEDFKKGKKTKKESATADKKNTSVFLEELAS